jgi:carotenoid cleavage dioxygenase-like enzyme
VGAVDVDVPLHLAGNNRPVHDEVTAWPTRVVGEVPAGLRGRFLRTGPNPRTGRSAHLYDGDGMVHALTLAGRGRAGPYRNRYVRTPLWANPGRSRLELAYDPATRRIDHRVTTANTNVVALAGGRLLALEEGGLPYELTPDLDTIGPFDFAGRLTGPMTAHPKLCPRTGELLFFGYRLRPPFVTLHRAAPDGTLTASVPLTLPAATMLHDFAITARRVVLVDSPLVFDPAAGPSPWRWDDAHGARIGVLPRTVVDIGDLGGTGDPGAGDRLVRWFEISPCHLSHALNAHDVVDDGDDGDGDGGRVVLTETRLARDSLPMLHLWTVDLRTGRVTEEPLDDTPSDYPRLADHRTGLACRYGYTASFALAAEPTHSTLYKYDLALGTRTAHAFPPGHTCGEPVFVPRGSSTDDEDDGYLLTFAHDRAAGTSYLAVLDATDLAAPPLAEVHLPVRIPAGFHSTWLPIRDFE